ncbi:MAG: anhydro-N-acetylmuramic acid kinase [bacterium]|nr:anhydro-N-acetylmuramic acid kinase [bacterium]
MIIIGVNASSEADGISAALCEINGAPPALQARVIQAITLPYDAPLRARLVQAATPDADPALLSALHVEVGEACAQAVRVLLRETHVRTAAVDLIGVQGVTVCEVISDDGRVRGLMQLGDPAFIAEYTGITTIDHFPMRDVAAKGRGAPLSGMFDWLIVRHPTRWRAVQHLDSVARVTILPPYSEEAFAPLAFDTGPGTVLIDAAVKLLTEGTIAADMEGQLAAQGEVDFGLLAYLLDDPYYNRKPPKTAGREGFNLDMVREIVRMGRIRGRSSADIVATLTALTARSIAHAYQCHAPALIDEIVIGGVGVHNPTLMQMLSDAVEPSRMLTYADLGIDGDHKEALVSAFLAHESWHQRAGNLPALTGAGRRVVLGQITPGKNMLELNRRTLAHDDLSDRD